MSITVLGGLPDGDCTAFNVSVMALPASYKGFLSIRQHAVQHYQ